jgi:hypothetical protein
MNLRSITTMAAKLGTVALAATSLTACIVAPIAPRHAVVYPAPVAVAPAPVVVAPAPVVVVRPAVRRGWYGHPHYYRY